MWEKIKKRLGKYGKWALIAFIIFELSQLALGIYGGVKLALNVTSDWGKPEPEQSPT